MKNWIGLLGFWMVWMSQMVYAQVATKEGEVYAFSYFKGNGEDGLHLAYSYDGWKWQTLQQDASFLLPELSADRLMRDPCIIRGGDGRFHMVWTVSWTDRGIGYASSDDLIHWSAQQYIPVMAHVEGTRNCWAPEITYDPAKDQYMIYWASTVTGLFPETQIEADNGYNHRMYYVTTRDFKQFSEAALLYEPGFNVIDATVVPHGDQWLMVLKDETREPAAKNLKLAYADQLTGPYSEASANISGKDWVEGPTVTKIGEDWVIYFDKYMVGKYGAIRSRDLETWEDVSDQIELPAGIRHGTIFKITQEELKRLQKHEAAVQWSYVGKGWSSNSVNAVVFRKNALATFQNTQYIAYYDAQGTVVLGKRTLPNGQWTTKATSYKGNVRDAHNSISIAVDGEGFLHIAFDHHNSALKYTRSVAPGSLELGKLIPMTGKLESRVTYPEFYAQPDGSLLFLYRNGASGRGNLVLNKYDVLKKSWSTLHANLIDGEGKRNAYPQATVDAKGTLHLSWVWRGSADVASNQDMAYARSKDGGVTWENSLGQAYKMPIRMETAEYAWRIPTNSELINQTSMAADDEGNPVIATYWRKQGETVPQYRLIYKQGRRWEVMDLNFRTEPFSLSGEGTKRIPIARPQIGVWGKGKDRQAWVLFRDEERNSVVSMAKIHSFSKNKFSVSDVSSFPVGLWEPSIDHSLWESSRKLHVFVQDVEQIDGEGMAQNPPTSIWVMQKDFNFKK
jgi:hypothetical protein